MSPFRDTAANALEVAKRLETRIVERNALIQDLARDLEHLHRQIASHRQAYPIWPRAIGLLAGVAIGTAVHVLVR